MEGRRQKKILSGGGRAFNPPMVQKAANIPEGLRKEGKICLFHATGVGVAIGIGIETAGCRIPDLLIDTATNPGRFVRRSIVGSFI